MTTGKSILVFVPAGNSMGKPEIVQVQVDDLEPGQIEEGDHYELATELVNDAGYVAGEPAFDENDIGDPQKLELWKQIAYTIQDEEEEEETVSLIASGYDWTCPSCGHNNNETESEEKVSCANCEKEFQVDSVDHTGN
ncbi:MAG TPA: hypothetical protein V6D07_18565 [Trichocoleus sp.]